MIFNWIELENFRQYKKVRLEFPTDKNAITLLIAQNGVGKTTLLQAFRFCFYGESPNYLKLANASELLNFSARNEMAIGGECGVSVSVHFTYDDEDYLAIRKINYINVRGVVKSKGVSSFALLRDDGTGMTQISDPTEMMNQIMPAGLAHIYMFDGERMEKRVETLEYKKDFKEAITGVLGLKGKEKARQLLGSVRERRSVIGKIQSKIIPVTDEESTLKRNEDSWVQEIKYNERKISEHNGTLLNIDSKIKEAESTLQREQEFKLVVENKQKLESKLERNESVLDSRINAGISLQSRAVLYIEILKHKEIFEKFMSKKGADEEIFTNLHRDVIESILKKGYCICGRPIEEHSKEMNKLLSLATLPNDNTVYLQGIESLFNRAQELPDILKQIRVIRGEISGLQSETRQLNIEYEKALKAVDNAQRENGSIDSGMNLASLRDLKYSAERSIRDLKNRNEKLNTNIKEVSSRLRTMRLNDQKNKKTQLVIDQLCKVADDLSNELKLKRITTQSTIERHLNESISELMENGLSATLSLDYELSIHKNVDNENVDETAVLSTGQSVMVSLSFLSALLKAVSEELPDKKSAVVMDAALSNVDERHIRLASDNVLTQFDQLIFMSFKRQLRRELFDGIHENVKMAYELSKDSSNNVILKELPLGSLKEYIERRDADGL